MAPRSLAPLRHRPFALFWSGAFVSNIGTWMETVAIGFYVTDVTGRSTWTGAVAAAAFVPTALLGPVGGALADRLPRRRLLLATTLAQAALASLLTALAVAGRPAPGLVTAIVFASGCASAIGFPAYQSVIPDLVPPEDLMSAIGLGSAQWNLGRVLGPLLAGVVIRVGGIEWALGVNAVSFLAVVAALLAIRVPPPHPQAGAVSLLASIRSGVSFVRREPGLRVVVLTMTASTLLAAPFIALVPAMAVNVLDAGAAGTSVLVAAQGLGAVTIALALGGLGARFGVRRVMLASLGGLVPSLVLYAAAPSLTLAAPALFLVGACYLGALSSFTTVTQQRAPARLRGRVLSVNTFVLGAVYPLGSLVQGALADRAGLRWVTGGAALLLGATMLVARVARPGATAALDAPPAAGPAGADTGGEPEAGGEVGAGAGVWPGRGAAR